MVLIAVSIVVHAEGCLQIFNSLVYPAYNRFFLSEVDCGKFLKRLHSNEAGSGGSNLGQFEIVQFLERSFLACCAWQKEAQVAKKQRHQLAGLWAVVTGRSVD